jgi:hypothetical protein
MRCASIKTLTIHTQTLSFFVIMSKSVILSLLAQGNSGTEILSILDTLVADIEQENIDDVAEYYAAL